MAVTLRAYSRFLDVLNRFFTDWDGSHITRHEQHVVCRALGHDGMRFTLP